jgi:hypothetical protein
VNGTRGWATKDEAILVLRLRARVAVGLAAFVGASACPLVVVGTASARGDVGAKGVDAGRGSTPPSVQAPIPQATRTQPERVDEQAVPPAPTSPPSATSPQTDVVEVIGPEETVGKEAPPATPSVTGPAKPKNPPDRFEVAGWMRESSEWLLAPSGFRQDAPSPLDVPHDRFISRSQIFVRASHVRERWFEATVSGVLGYSFREEGPSGANAFDGINGQASTADLQVDLRELYVGFFSTYFDFRIGQQRVAWGRADLQSPNDVLNARDLRDPILSETELRHVPTPLLRADIDMGAATLQLVGTPVFVPDVYDVYGTNWAAIQEDAAPAVKTLFASVWPRSDPTKQAQFDALVHDTQLPAANWTAPSGGAKVSTVVGGTDLDFYYHYGFDSTPYVSFNPSPISLLLTPTQPFSATYVRRHHVGFDAATTAGPLGLRIDVGYDTMRVYYHADFTSLSSPSVTAVASIEYQTGDIDKVILLEATYNRLVDGLDKPLLGYDQNSFGIAGTFRWPLWEGWAIDLRGLAGVEPVSFAMQPALRWKLSDSVFLKAGMALLGGEKNSLGWYYRHNTSAFLQAKYLF